MSKKASELLQESATPFDTACMMVREMEDRLEHLEDLLTSAHAIAERHGEGTAWKRFANQLSEAGIGCITAKTFTVLPSDVA